MSYLFQSRVEPAVQADMKNARYLKVEICEKETKSLIETHGREFNCHDDQEAAEQLVREMGTKFKPESGPHVQDRRYVGDAWRMVSDNCHTIHDMVSGELYRAYQIGLDTRSEFVIGRMYFLAVQVWSMIGAYSGYSQDEGRR